MSPYTYEALKLMAPVILLAVIGFAVAVRYGVLPCNEQWEYYDHAIVDDGGREERTFHVLGFRLIREARPAREFTWRWQAPLGSSK